MSTTSVLNKYINIIRSNYNLDIFEEEVISTDDITGESVTVSRPKLVTENVCTSISNASNSIFMAFDVLFNSHKIEDGQNQNFMVINAFSENYRNYDQYNDGSFSINKTYTNCCGKFYHASAIGSSGEFLLQYKVYPDNITDICLYYETLYDDFVPVIPLPTLDDTPTETEPKITQFWNIYINEFTSKVNAQKTMFDNLKSDFSSFEVHVQNYIDIGQNNAMAFAVGSVFIDSDKKTTMPYINMAQDWNTHENKFLYYSSDIENIYKLWLTSATETDKIYSVNATEYEYDSIRQNIFFSLILTYKDFWNQSNIIDEFISKFNENYQF